MREPGRGASWFIRRALEMEPNNGAYIDSLGWLFFKQSKFEEALTELLRAAELLPEPDPVVFEHIGDACDKLGERQRPFCIGRRHSNSILTRRA